VGGGKRNNGPKNRPGRRKKLSQKGLGGPAIKKEEVRWYTSERARRGWKKLSALQEEKIRHLVTSKLRGS